MQERVRKALEANSRSRVHRARGPVFVFRSLVVMIMSSFIGAALLLRLGRQRILRDLRNSTAAAAELDVLRETVCCWLYNGIATELSVPFRRNVRTTSTIRMIAVMIRTASVTINHGPRSGKVNRNSPHELNIIGTLSNSITGRTSSHMSRKPTRNSRCPRRCPNF